MLTKLEAPQMAGHIFHYRLYNELISQICDQIYFHLSTYSATMVIPS